MPRLLVVLIVFCPAFAGADVVDRSPAGFTVKTVVTVAVSPERAFKAFVDDIGRWWDSSHTFSGDAGNLRITATPGGCFCETLKNAGGVAHAIVNHVVPGELLRMSGALGPLQEHAVTGTLTWQFAASGQDATVTLTYSVGGYFPGGLEKIAGPVDQVLSDQLKRLKAYVESGAGAQEAPAPARAITNIRGDLYRVQDGAHYTVFLVTPAGIVLGDPINPEAATWLKGELGRRFPNRPVRYVLYSHHDFDHASGATVFNDTAEVIGHADFNSELKRAQTAVPEFFAALDTNKNGRFEKNEQTGPFAALLSSRDRNGDGTVTPAELYTDVMPTEASYSRRRIITLGGKTVEMIHPGPAHARDMTVLLFPAERAVFGVDFLPVRALPFGFAPSTPDEVVASARAVEALDFDTFVPGHGNVGTKQDVVAFRQYVEDLTRAVRDGINAGRTVEQIQASNVLDKYKDWPNFAQQKNANVAEVYALLPRAR
jgi:glyoxylase-like metal-dependent hydrolase (beta-lactamase superfamily II)/uncharacterized protein YndB with AHSA1/START domain